MSGRRTSRLRGPWIADEARRERMVVEDGARARQPFGQGVGDDGRVARVGHDHEPVVGEAIDDEVVEDPAVGGHDHRVLGPADRQARWGADQRRVERGRGLLALDPQLAHVRQVEQPGPLADGAVLLEDGRVLDRHPPAGEVDHPGAEGLVSGRQRRLVGRARGVLAHEAASARSSGEVPVTAPATMLRGVGHERPLGLERQHPRRLVEVDPADLVELAVVAIQVSADRLHQEVVHGLVDARPGLDEDVLDGVEDTGDADFQARSPRRPRGGPSPRSTRHASACPWGGSRRVRPALDGGCRRRVGVGRPRAGRRCRLQTWRSRSSAGPRRRVGARGALPVRVHPTASSASAPPGADDHSWPTAGRAVGCASRRAVGTPRGHPSAAAPSCGRSPGRRSPSTESQPTLPSAAGRANESRRRPGRVLGGDAVSHGPQW